MRKDRVGCVRYFLFMRISRTHAYGIIYSFCSVYTYNYNIILVLYCYTLHTLTTFTRSNGIRIINSVQVTNRFAKMTLNINFFHNIGNIYNKRV